MHFGQIVNFITPPKEKKNKQKNINVQNISETVLHDNSKKLQMV